MSATEAGRARLLALVVEAYRETYQTRGGIDRPKTRKQRQLDWTVAEAVVRFAYDHGGYAGEHLAPGGLWAELQAEAGR
jgi:hypothetical protein